ncbi:MAG: hypothetical protein K6G60_01495 [Lachnospiraceae bacterium]|nr:hypothetical protein [Lachnospiraceae bacterium]
MIEFINTNFSLKQKIALYRILYTLNEMDFSYLRPLFSGSVTALLLFFRFAAPESFILSLTVTQLALFNTLCISSVLCFLIFLHPYIRKIIARFRIYNYRRKKRATRSLFRFN